MSKGSETSTETEVEGTGVGDGAEGKSAGALGAGSSDSTEASSLEVEGAAQTEEVSGEASSVTETAGEGEGDDGGEAREGEGKKPAATPREDWRDRRIAKLTARLKAEQEKPAANGEAPLDPTADFNKRVREAAAAQVAAETFANACNSAARQGYEEFGEAEFKARLNALRSLVDTSVPEEVEKYNQFLTAGLETGELHKIIFELGEDLSEADRLLGLSPIKMAVELAKRVVAPEPSAAPVSRLPKPIRPIGTARGDTGFMDPSDPSKADNLDTAAWMKAREAQVAKAAR